MDIWSETAVLFTESFYSPGNLSTLIWDNITTHDVIQEDFKRPTYSWSIFGWVFLGAFGTGFFLHCFSTIQISRFMPDEWDSSDGQFNPAYVDDESQPPENDRPPDYNSVVSGIGVNETSRNQRFMDFLSKLVPKKKTAKENVQEEERPPSYSAALVTLQREISNS